MPRDFSHGRRADTEGTTIFVDNCKAPSQAKASSDRAVQSSSTKIVRQGKLTPSRFSSCPERTLPFGSRTPDHKALRMRRPRRIPPARAGGQGDAYACAPVLFLFGMARRRRRPAPWCVTPTKAIDTCLTLSRLISGRIHGRHRREAREWAKVSEFPCRSRLNSFTLRHQRSCPSSACSRVA